MRRVSLYIFALLISCCPYRTTTIIPIQSIGGGTLIDPASGPGPAFSYGDDTVGYKLVKNWDFGSKGTIRNIAEMTENFQYHDQFLTFSNGTKYGAKIVAADSESALKGQPVELINTSIPVREITDSSLKTYLVPLDDAETVNPTTEKAGCGSFQAKWTLPSGGKLLGKDIIWETRVRYNTPPYYWFAIWACGNEWNHGAEMDLVESFGFDNGDGFTNFNGSFWHSSVVGGTSETNYHNDWVAAMKKYGFENYDATQWHIWTWVYHDDDTFTSYLDGKVVQRGKTPWTLGAVEGGKPVNMSFIFDAGWGHAKVASVNHPLRATAFIGKYYEWDYSRIYLRETKQ